MKLTINNIQYELESDDELTLLDFLREKLDLTGAKRGCDDGTCGACTVIVNGDAKRSCKLKLSELNGAKITTIEGLEKNPKSQSPNPNFNGQELHPIQQAFLDAGAVQCGFCTPAMILTAKALLDKNPKPTDDEIKKAFAGNLCRCTGYKQIFDAIKRLSSPSAS